MKWEMHKCGVQLLGLWSLARSLPEKLGRGMTPGEERSVGPCWSLTWIVYRLVKELDCVKSQAPGKNGGLTQEDFTQKKALSQCLTDSTQQLS